MKEDENTVDPDEALWDGGLAEAFQPADPEPLPWCGRFRLVEEIARGGIGTIHRAWDDRLARDIAIKRLRDEHVDDTAMITRFLAEARVGARLQHPGVLPVYDSGIDAANRPFLCMKLVEGRTMVQLLREEPADLARRLDVFRQVCRTIAFAHDRGVVHRDLKPSNVMIGEFGEVLVVDWGFAKILFEDGEGGEPEPGIGARTEGSSSVAGSILGTPAYMPPEQACGRIADLDERVDVFALGAILCEILTGAPPYPRKSSQHALEHAARGDLDAALRRLDGCGADEALVSLCRACLEPEATSRPRDAGAVSAEVERWFSLSQASRERALVEAAEARGRIGEERKRRNVISVVAVAVLAVVIGGGALVWRESNRRRDVRASAARACEAALRDFEGHMANEDWTAAGESISRAIVHARTGHDEDGAALIRDARARLASARREADAREARRARIDAFETALQNAYSESIESPPDRDRAFSELFRKHGIDLDRLAPAAAVERVREEGLDVDLVVPTLDEWAATRRIARDPGGRRPRAIRAPVSRESRLLDVADALDPDPRRVELRRAARSAEPEELVELARSIDVDEHDPHGLVMLAVTLLGARHDVDAIALLERAQRRHPGDFWINHHLSVMLRAPGLPGSPRQPSREDCERALHHAWLAVAARPDSLFAREHVARALLDLGRAEEAFAVLDDAEGLSPDRVALVRVRLTAHCPLGVALSQLRERVAAAPGDDRARAELASLLVLLGDFAAAEREARSSLAGGAAPGAGVHALITALCELGRHDEALKAARALGLPDSDPLLADALRIGRVDRPAAPLERMARGRRLLQSGRVAEAASVFADFIEGFEAGGAPWRRDPEARPAPEGARRRRPEGRGSLPRRRSALMRRTMAAALLGAAAEHPELAERYGEAALRCLRRDLRGPAGRRPDRRLEAWLHDVRLRDVDAAVANFSPSLRARWTRAWGEIEAATTR